MDRDELQIMSTPLKKHKKRGRYSYGHQGGDWRRNKMWGNVQYGFDPHVRRICYCGYLDKFYTATAMVMGTVFVCAAVGVGVVLPTTACRR